MTRGSRYRCGQVGSQGRGIQSTPNAPSYPLQHSRIHKATKTLIFPRFYKISSTDWGIDGLTDQWTDKASYRVACPHAQLKTSRLISPSVLALTFLFLWSVRDIISFLICKNLAFKNIKASKCPKFKNVVVFLLVAISILKASKKNVLIKKV